MDEVCIARAVVLGMAKELKLKTEKTYIPTAVSNRHVHLSETDIEKLFGRGYTLTEFKPLSQPGQFAAKETVEIKGPKGAIENVRILGPARGATQVEIFVADGFKLGIKPVLRMSGNIAGTPGAVLIGPAGAVTLNEGVIVAARHLHLSPEESEWIGLADGDVIAIRKPGDRAITIENIPVRCGKGHSLECHLDMEEANAGLITNGELLELVSVNRK